MNNVHHALSDVIFIAVNYSYVKIAKADILFVEAAGGYVEIYTTDRKYQHTIHLKQFSGQLGDDSFVRVSRKHVVNLKHIDSIRGNVLYIQKNEILIGKQYRSYFLDFLPIIRTK